jgi:hypothetical protein
LFYSGLLASLAVRGSLVDKAESRPSNPADAGVDGDSQILLASSNPLMDVEIVPRTFKCTVCSVTFSAKFSLLNHERVCHEHRQQYKCMHCCVQLRYDSPQELKFHYDTMHRECWILVKHQYF